MKQKEMTLAVPIPAYAELPDANLINLLFTAGDRLPMAFAQDAVSRGERLVPALSGVVRDRKNWERNDAGWAAVIHASFLLGAIGGDQALQVLLEVIRLSEEFDNDWVASELPAIFGRLGPKALPFLKEAALDQGEEWPYRHRALSAMAAVASRHPEHAEDVFPFIASIAQDAKEDGDTRAWAGCVLLDFPQERYRELLHSLIDLGTAGRIFDERSIDRSFSKMKPRLGSYQRDWLQFYAPGQIAERQKRWEKERLSEEDAWEEAASPVNDVDEYDKFFAPPEEETDQMSRRQILEALGPVAELIPRTREAIEASEGELDKAAVEKHAALATELGKAIRIRDAKSSRGPKTLSLFNDALGRHDLFGWLVPLPMKLAAKGMVGEGATLAKLWSAVAEAENFLGDRAVILAEAGLAEEAREQIKENLERFPEDTWIRIKAGIAYRAIKDFTAAEAEYREGLALAGDHRGDRSAAIDRIAALWRETGRMAEADALEADERRRLEQEEQRRYGASQTVVRSGPKVGRNDPCPCGSGKKHKKCCGR